MLAVGVALEVVQRTLGHASLGTTRSTCHRKRRGCVARRRSTMRG
ncbi:hypothetical protein [Burkholderia sp. SIMBA_062]